jgi:hypothetical protein
VPGATRSPLPARWPQKGANLREETHSEPKIPGGQRNFELLGHCHSWQQ